MTCFSAAPAPNHAGNIAVLRPCKNPWDRTQSFHTTSWAAFAGRDPSGNLPSSSSVLRHGNKAQNPVVHVHNHGTSHKTSDSESITDFHSSFGSGGGKGSFLI